MINPMSLTAEYATLKKITEPLTTLILQQQTDLFDTCSQQTSLKSMVRRTKRELEKKMADQVTSNSNIQQKRAAEWAQEKGASSWLTVLPLQGHGFHLDKNSFRDALCLRYGWLPKNLTDQCPCGSAFTVEHSLSCPKGGFPTIRHNEIRDLFAELIRDVCPNVEIEPTLQPLNGEAFKYRSTTTDDKARLDIAANGFWGGRFERTFYDVLVFNPYASSYLNTDIST